MIHILFLEGNDPDLQEVLSIVEVGHPQAVIDTMPKADGGLFINFHGNIFLINFPCYVHAFTAKTYSNASLSIFITRMMQLNKFRIISAPPVHQLKSSQFVSI